MLLNNTSSFEQNPKPLHMVDIPIPIPVEKEILIKIKACGVCHTELDEIEGRATPSFFPIILGHQIAGIVAQNGANANKFKPGDRVGVGWIFSSCGKCSFCLSGLENLCSDFKATGKDANGGYAEYICVPEVSAFIIPNQFSDAEAAPLLCGGAIGYRSLKLANIRDGQTLGLTGFGASGHQVLQLSKFMYPSSKVFVFSRSEKESRFAMTLGADWAGLTDQTPPELTDSIIDTTPAWKPIVMALQFLKPGGRLVINAIRKEDADKDQLLTMNYRQHLWMEKEIKSVANITRKDIEEFLPLAAAMNLKPTVTTIALEDANQALFDLKKGGLHGAQVLVV